MRFGIWLSSVCLTVLMTSLSSPQGRGQTVLTHTTPLYCSTSEGCSNPTVYHYTLYRLNTRQGEGMTECMHGGVHSVHVPKHAFFFFKLKQLGQCVYMCVCGPAGLSHPVSPLPLYICSEQQRVCVQACLCVCLHNAEQPCLPPQLEKKSHNQEATLKYQVLIWQIQATGVFTFQRLRREKDQMPL